MTGALWTDGVVVDVGDTQLFVAESGHGRADATCVVFEDSGHLPFIEEPDRFARVVRSWLDSLPDHRAQGGDHA